MFKIVASPEGSVRKNRKKNVSRNLNEIAEHKKITGNSNGKMREEKKMISGVFQLSCRSKRAVIELVYPRQTRVETMLLLQVFLEL